MLQNTRDLVGLAHTGTGKTAAFGIPIIQQIDPLSPKTQALILAPTRELCLQITEELRNYSQYIDGINIVPIYGGANIETQIKQVAAGAQIVVATPGRMLDMLRRRKVHVSSINWLVLDEADEMLDMGFKEDLDAILSGTAAEKRVMLFSATMPRGVESIAHSYMNKPQEITVGSKNTGAENIQHHYYVAHAKDRYAALKRIVDFYPGIYAIIFCRTKIETQEIADALIKDGYNADALHGDLSQTQRDSVMNRFRTRNLQMLVATDVAARGIDVTDLTHIINYNLPEDNENYTHRSGRTGRAGKSGISVVIINLKEHFRIGQIERQIGKKFEQIKIPTGREVCTKQLLHLVDKLKSAEVRQEDIKTFLPEAYKKLAELSKEEIIQRFIWTEFNRFLNYYRNAPDINVEQKKETGKPSAGTVRLFINLGQRENFTEQSLKNYLISSTHMKDLRISHIEVTRSCSFFEIDLTQAEYFITRLQKLKFQQRRVQLDFAEKGKIKSRHKKPPNSFFIRKRKRWK